jgi:hypothetical protein
MITRSRMIVSLTLAWALAGTALAQQTKIVESGQTTVVLSGDFVNALKTLAITPGVISPTQLNGTTVNFPITSGAVDLSTGAGNIVHSGGLTLSSGGTQVSLENFIIDTVSKPPVITGLVVGNGTLVSRINLFDIGLGSLPLPLTLDQSVLLNIPNVSLTLDAAAASALNQALKTNAFTAGFTIGTAQVRAFTNGWVPQQ